MNRKYFNKLILIILAILTASYSDAQDKEAIYIVVEAQKIKTESERTYNVVRSTYISKNYKEPVQTFNLYVPSMDVCFWRLWHFYRLKPKANETAVNPKDQHKTYLKDSSFLNSVNCLFWDDIIDLDYGDAKEYIRKLLFKVMPDGAWVERTIYLVDLAEKHSDGKIKLYQVEDMTKEWTKTIFWDENDRQEWINHSNKVKEKIDKRRADRKAKQFKK